MAIRLLHDPGGIVPIPSTRSIEHFQENLEATQLKLTREEIAEVEAAVPCPAIYGERHPAEHLKTINL